MTNPGDYSSWAVNSLEAARNAWLQRWVGMGEISPSQADAVVHFDASSGSINIPTASGPNQVLVWIERWQGAGILTGVQSARLAEDVRQSVPAPPAPPASPAAQPVAQPAVQPTASAGQTVATGTAPSAKPAGNSTALVIELLGYAGAALATVSSIWLMRNVWEQFNAAVQLTIVGVIAAVLTAATFLIRVGDVPAFRRLRASTGLAASATFGALGAVVAVQVIDTRYPPTVLFVVSLFLFAHSAVLWSGRERVLQQIVAFLGLLAATWSGMYLLERVYGPATSRTIDVYSSESVYSAWRGYTGLALLCIGALLIGLSLVRSIRFTVVSTLFGVAAVMLAVLPLGQGFSTVGLSIEVIVVSAVCALLVATRVPLTTEQRVVGCSIVGAGGLYWLVAVPFASRQVEWQWVGVTLACAGVVLTALAILGEFEQRDLTDIAAMLPLIAGLCLFGIGYDWLAPILGILAAAIVLVFGFRSRRVGLLIAGWLAAGIFGIWELVWVGQQVNITAVVALVVGAVMVAVAVFLNRRVQRAKGRRGDGA